MATRANAVTRVTGGLMIVAALAFAGLLMAYVHVLEAGMRQGEVRRIAWNEHARAVWRCNVLPVQVERQKCLLKLSASLREVL
jgi:hypothetical protein